MEDDDEVVLVLKNPMADPWKKIFDQLDNEGFGEVPIKLLHDWITRPSWGYDEEEEEWQELNPTLLLSRLQDLERSGRDVVNYQEFVSIVTRKRRLSFKCAVHSRDRQVLAVGDFKAKKPKSGIQRLREILSRAVLTSKTDQNYFETTKCFNPPLVMAVLSVFQVIFFLNQTVQERFEFLPCYKEENMVWRYFTYCLIHSDAIQLSCNLGAQIVIGIPLEIVYGSVRLLLLYVFGVLGGSLLSLAFDCETLLVGGNGGVLSVIMALVTYWTLHGPVEGPKLTRIGLLIGYTSLDVGIGVYRRFASSQPISLMGHLGGITTGVLLGSAMLKHLDLALVNYTKTYCAFAAFVSVFVCLLVFATIRGQSLHAMTKTTVYP